MSSLPHTFSARPLFDETFAQSDIFAVVNCPAVALGVFYSTVLTRSPMMCFCSCELSPRSSEYVLLPLFCLSVERCVLILSPNWGIDKFMFMVKFHWPCLSLWIKGFAFSANCRASFLPRSTFFSDGQSCHFWCFNIRFDVWEKFLMPDVLVTKLMLTELLFLVSTSPILLAWKEISLIIVNFLSSISHPHVCLVIVPNWRSSLYYAEDNI